MKNSYLAKVVTVSDSAFENKREDLSGKLLIELAESAGFEVIDTFLTKDGIEEVKEILLKESNGFKGFIFTTGGTGFSKRDLTPEATNKVIQRFTPGIDEAIRAVSDKAKLSRGVSGIVDDCIIINFPGSTKAVKESFEAVQPILSHAISLLLGSDTSH